MDIISEVRFFVDDMDVSNKVFSEGLGFKAISPAKKFCSYEMESGSQIMIYSDYDMWRENPQHIHLRVAENKIEKVHQILVDAGKKDFYHTKGEELADIGPRQKTTLDWTLKNLSTLSLESEESLESS